MTTDAIPVVDILTVGELLTMPPVAAAQPEVLAGGTALDNPVRWVHVSGIPAAIGFMRGGEVLVTNAGGWPTAVDSLIEIANELVQRGAAGVILELNSRFPAVHPAFVRVLADAGIAVAQLHARIDSVEVTERAHRRILLGQQRALEARDEVHQLLIGLTLRGSSAEFLVGELGRILQTRVILLNSSREVVAIGGGDWASTGAAALAVAVSLSAGRTETGPDTLHVPIAARGREWGTLIALPGPAHPAGRRVVLEQGAIALALERLASRDDDQWLREAAQSLFIDVLGGRFTSTGAIENRLSAFRFPLVGRRLQAAVFTGDSLPTADEIVAAAARSHWTAISATHHGSSGSRQLVVFSLPPTSVLSTAVAGSFLTELGSGEGSAGPRMLIGPPGTTVPQLVDSLLLATALADESVDKPFRGPILHVEARPLLGMLSAVRRDPWSQRRANDVLKPVTDYDTAYGTDLMTVLIAVIHHPASRSSAAAASGLSRSSFYKRLAVLEDLLSHGEFGLDLNDHESLLTLQLAIEVLHLGP